MNTGHPLRIFQVTTLALVLVTGGCRAKGTQPGGANVHASNAAPASSLSPKSVVDESADHGGLLASDAQAHDSAHPPIDCPLHKLGIDPMHLRPFDDVEKYIAFLEKPERAIWQKPDDVVAALGLKGSETLIDVGAGSGYFTFRFAKALPHGKVIAADTEAEMIRHIHHKVMSDGIPARPPWRRSVTSAPRRQRGHHDRATSLANCRNGLFRAGTTQSRSLRLPLWREHL